MPFILDAPDAEDGATLTELLTEFYARGYNYLDDGGTGAARATRWANQAVAEITTEELWPFRLTTTSGAAPLTINSLDQVLTVIDTSNSNLQLHEMTERELTAFDLDMTGQPLWFYRDSLQIRVWPLSTTATIEVRYWALPTEMTLGTDETMIPKRYMDVIVDAMVRRGAKDSESESGVALAQREVERGLALMRKQLLVAPTHMEHVAWTSEDE